MIRRNIKPVLVFISVSIIGAVLVYLTDGSCEAVRLYSWSVQFDIGHILFSIIRMGLILISGLFLFNLVKKKIPQEKYVKVKLIYFGVLPFLVFYNQFLAIPKNIWYHSIVSSICQKSSVDGMQTQSENITQNEYDYLKNKLFLLPDIPQSADSIVIDYYNDPFFGDYRVDVCFVCNINDAIDTTTDKHWKIIPKYNSATKKHVSYIDDSLIEKK